jgi:hypothetical protein
MANFDEILSGLHTTSTLTDAQTEAPIVITARRTFEV